MGEMVEVWKDIPEHLGLSRYQASSLGRIRNKRSGYVLSRKPRKSGYIHMSLSVDEPGRKTNSFLVHRLIALTFIPNSENKPTVDHINKLRSDNRVKNLRWANRKEQHDNKDSFQRRGIPVLQIHPRTGRIVKKWNKMKMAEESLGICSGSIGMACRGKYETVCGYKWEFATPKQLKGEKWKYSETYKIHVSNLGRIKTAKGYISYGARQSCGYMMFSYSKKKSKCVHILVAELFIPNSDGKPIVDHVNGNKSDNRAENLEWVTYKENTLRAHELGLVKPSTNLSTAVKQFDLKGNYIQTFPSMSTAAKELGLQRQAISKVCQGIFKQTGGFRFEYADSSSPGVKRSHRKAVKIDHIDENGRIILTYDSAMDAAKDLNVSPSNIHQVCKGIYKQTGGCRFVYHKD